MATVVKSLVKKKLVIPSLRMWNPNVPLKEVDHYITIVRASDGNYYKVSSVFTVDHGYETMAFECDSTGELTDWMDLYCEQYETEDEMISDHKRVVDLIDEYL